MLKGVEIYKDKKDIIAVVIRSRFRGKGNNFFTKQDSTMQLAFVGHKKGKVIEPHRHNRLKREVSFTQEVDIVRKGRIRVYLYDNRGKFHKSLILKGGDIILFASGGHGYRVLEDLELILVKQGPYAGTKDKTYLQLHK